MKLLKQKLVHFLQTPPDKLSHKAWLFQRYLLLFAKYFWAVAIILFIGLAYTISVSYYIYFFYFAIGIAIISKIIEWIIIYLEKKQKN